MHLNIQFSPLVNVARFGLDISDDVFYSLCAIWFCRYRNYYLRSIQSAVYQVRMNLTASRGISCGIFWHTVVINVIR